MVFPFPIQARKTPVLSNVMLNYLFGTLKTAVADENLK